MIDIETDCHNFAGNEWKLEGWRAIVSSRNGACRNGRATDIYLELPGLLRFTLISDV